MVNIDILQSDIDQAEQLIEEKSPLCLALKRIFPNSVIHVGIVKAQVDNLILNLSPQLVQYLEDYDLNGTIEPIKLEMDITIKG